MSEMGDGDGEVDDADASALLAEERAQIRASDLETHVLPYIQKEFAQRPEYRSAMLVVSQHYADNAMDEVHGHLIFSKDELPRWPHWCDWDVPAGARETLTVGEPCTRCGRFGTYFSFPYGESTFRGWEAYCPEASNQEQSLPEAYLPYAVIKRDLSIEIVAEPVRPWLDAPVATTDLTTVTSSTDPDPLFDLVYANPDDLAARHVLADALLERGDQRGEYLAMVLASSPPDREARQRAEAIFAEHSRQWLGPLAAIASPGRVRYANGFVDHVAAYFADYCDTPTRGWQAAAANAREWATVRSLTFLPRSLQPLGDAMRHVRRLGPLGDGAILELNASSHVWRIEHLHVAPTELSTLELLAVPKMAERLAHLKTLVVSGHCTKPSDVAGAQMMRSPLWRNLEALHISSWLPYDQQPPRPIDVDNTAAWMEMIFSDPLRGNQHQKEVGGPRELGFGSLGESGEPAGPWIYLRADSTAGTASRSLEARITIPAFGSKYDIGHLGGAIAALPNSMRARLGNVVIEPSHAFHPNPLDVRLLDSLGILARL